MSFLSITAPKPFARDIVAYSDAEFDHYLEQCRRTARMIQSDGSVRTVQITDIVVEDPENLPDEFIQKLRDRVSRISETAQSLPVNLDQVAARLQDVSADRDRSVPRQPSPASTADIDEEEEHRKNIEYETESYNMLVKDDGRPSHPLSLLEDIIKDPGEYREILRFWQAPSFQENKWKVFTPQWKRWYDFRRLQRYARGQSNFEYWRSDWEAKRVRYISVGLQGFMETEDGWDFEYQRKKESYGDERVVDVGGQKRPWRQFVKREGHTPDEPGFPEYVEALKERLVQHGFTRTFQLDKDLDQQDKLTTWIEYLGYEYWWYDQHANFHKRRQRLHDEAWEELVDAKVLRRGETEEVICNIETAFERQSERESAEQEVHQLQQRLPEAQSILDMAKERHESIKTRNQCITKFIQRINPYRQAKEDAKHHEILLRWILQQVPSIELESNPPNAASNGSDRRDGRRMLKRNRPEDIDEELPSINVNGTDRPFKRPKNNGRMISDPSDLTTLTGVLDESKTVTATITSQTRRVKLENFGKRSAIKLDDRNSTATDASIANVNATIDAQEEIFSTNYKESLRKNRYAASHIKDADQIKGKAPNRGVPPIKLVH